MDALKQGDSSDSGFLARIQDCYDLFSLPYPVDADELTAIIAKFKTGTATYLQDKLNRLP